MSETSEPPLAPEIKERIATAQYEVHKNFHDSLLPLRNPAKLSFAMEKFTDMIERKAPEPEMPKQPFRLFEILNHYASKLFATEHSFYPRSPEVQNWRITLAAKIEQLVVSNVERIGGLTFHATFDQMRVAIRQGLQNDIEQLKIVVRKETPEPPIKPVSSRFVWAPQEQQIVIDPQNDKSKSSDTCHSRSVKRKALRDAYLKSLEEKVMILDICWAAKQHYREWTRWISGELKDDLKADKAFKALMNSGKRPEEYRPGTREKKWR